MKPITCTFLAAMWLFFSSVAISAENAGLNLQATALFRENAGQLEQMVRARVPDPSKTEATLVVEGPGYTRSHKLSSLAKIRFDNRDEFLFPFPEVRQPTTVRARLENAGPTVSGDYTLQPQRKWEIHVIHSTHTDVGYTDLADRVRRQLAAHYRTVLKTCQATENYPPEAKFRWVVEAFLPLEDFWKEATETERQQLLKYMREDRIEVTACYAPHLSDNASHESLFRFFFHAPRFGREQGIPVRSSMFSDSTGYAWAIPQILNSLGIRYLSTAVNPTRALNPFTELPRSVYWESPDGSRVLLWNSDPKLAYAEGYMLGLAGGYPGALSPLLGYLEQIEKGSYRFETLGLRVAFDNRPPAPAISETIRDWNSQWKFPHLIFSTNYNFLRTLEERHGKDIPTVRAAWPDWWSDFCLSGAWDAGVHRLSHDWLSAAERLSALARLAHKDSSLDPRDLAVARQRMLMADEPIWGYMYAALRPRDWRTRGCHSERTNDVHTAAMNARGAADEAAQALFGHWTNWSTFVVYNPLGWSRTGNVEVELPGPNRAEMSGKVTVLSVRDKQSGKVAPLQWLRSDEIGMFWGFLAEDVPPLGYRVFEIVDRPPADAQPQRVRIGDKTLENNFYRIRVDEKRGGIVSILDKEMNRELVDQSAPFGFNQYIYERPPHGDFKQVMFLNQAWEKKLQFERFPAIASKVREGKKGPAACSLIIEGSAKMTPLVRQEIILYPSLKQIDVINTIRKQEIVAAEAAHIAFPFAMQNPVVRLEAPDSIFTVDKEQLPNSARDWYAVQHWVKLSDGATDILWTPLEAPIVQFGEIHTQRWLKQLPLSNGSLYSSILCNYWVTNEQPSQGGEMVFRYSIASQKHSTDDIAATHFGWNQVAPFMVVGPGYPPPPSPTPPISRKPVESFCHIDATNVLPITFKNAEDGRGHVLRLLEFSGKPTKTKVRFGPFEVEKVSLLDAAEQDSALGKVPTASVKDGALQVELRPFELTTLRVQFRE